MIALNSLVPAEQTKFLIDLVTLLSDAAAAKERIKEFADANAELKATHEELQKTQLGFNAAEQEHTAKLAAARAAQEAELAAERKKFNEERLQIENGFAARDKRLAAAEAKLKAAVEAADERRADLDRRLALLKSLSAA